MIFRLSKNNKPLFFIRKIFIGIHMLYKHYSKNKVVNKWLINIKIFIRQYKKIKIFLIEKSYNFYNSVENLNNAYRDRLHQYIKI